MYINLFKRINSKISLIHKTSHICYIYTPWETLEKFRFTLPRFPLYLIKFALNNVIVGRCNLLRFGVNFDKILLNENIQKRIIFIYNNDTAADIVELWSSSTNAKYAESNSTIYILCEKQKKSNTHLSTCVV